MSATATSSAFPKLSDPVGVFGGTFDPVHFGHLRLAEESMAHLGLGAVRWIPAGNPPHRGQPQVTALQRLEMVQRSTAGNPRFQVDASEVLSMAPSYTVDTLTRLRVEYGPTQPLVLLVEPQNEFDAAGRPLAATVFGQRNAAPPKGWAEI